MSPPRQATVDALTLGPCMRRHRTRALERQRRKKERPISAAYIEGHAPATMAHLLRGKQAGISHDLSAGIAPDLFGLDHVCHERRILPDGTQAES